MSTVSGLINSRYYYSHDVIEDNLVGMAAVHNGLIVLEDCRAILRKDYDNMLGKVRLISSGTAGAESTGFIGPGMLTGVISGTTYAAPPIDAILKVITEVSSNRSPGVLMIIPNSLEYHVNFTLAKLYAEEKGCIVKTIMISDNLTSDCFGKITDIENSLSIFFIDKIAGAMSDEGRNLDEIYTMCNNVANSGEIITFEIEYKNVSPERPTVSKLFFKSIRQTAKSLIESLNRMSRDQNETSSHQLKIFCAGHEVAVMMNNFGCSQIETNLLILEVLKQLETFGLITKRIYIGPVTSNQHNCFSLTLLNLSITPLLIAYLDAPTSVPGWPKILSAESMGFKQDDEVSFITPGKYFKTITYEDINLQGPTMDCHSGQIFLTIISIACEALIACSNQLNIIGEESGNNDCGSTLACGANAIKNAIQENKLMGTNPFVTFTQISYTFRSVGGLYGGLYSLFFYNAAKSFLKYQINEQITVDMWVNALIHANTALIEFGKLYVGNRTMVDALIPAQEKLTDALNQKLDPIDAFGAAVKVAEDSAMKTINMQPPHLKRIGEYKEYKYSDPGAHAVGIWMRAAYEGTKLRLVSYCKE